MRVKDSWISIYTAIISVVLTIYSFTARAASQESVFLEYLYINKRLITNTEKKITLYREMLPGGVLEIAGKGVSKDAPVASIEVSTDNQGTWEETPILPDGTFRLSIKTEMGMKLRILIRITDMKGIVNDVNTTYNEITIPKITLNRIVRETLDGLSDSYMGNDARRAMSYFSEDYVGDKSIYDRRIRRRLSRVSGIDIRCSVNNITADALDKVSVSFNFNRRYTSLKTGRTIKDSGVATIIFNIENGGLKVYSIIGKSPF
jgi:hypothetical protein